MPAAQTDILKWMELNGERPLLEGLWFPKYIFSIDIKENP